MNEVALWISGGALLIAVLAFLHSLSRASAANRISIEQKRSELRLESHLVALRLVGLADQVLKLSPSEQISAIAKNLADAGTGIIDFRAKIAELNPPPFIGATMLTTAFESYCADMKEMLRVLDLAESAFSEKRYDDLQMAVEGLHRRVWAGEKEPTKPDSALDRADRGK